MAQAARPEHRDQAGGARARDLHRLIGGDAGARQRRRVQRVDVVRDAHDVAGVAERVLGEAAVHAIARVDLRGAQRAELQ